MEFVILIAVILAVVGAYSIGAHTALEAYKEGLELNLQLRTKEPEKVEIPAKHPSMDITKLFSFDGHEIETPTDSTDTMALMDEYLNGPKEERR